MIHTSAINFPTCMRLYVNWQMILNLLTWIRNLHLHCHMFLVSQFSHRLSFFFWSVNFFVRETCELSWFEIQIWTYRLKKIFENQTVSTDVGRSIIVCFCQGNYRKEATSEEGAQSIFSLNLCEQITSWNKKQVYFHFLRKFNKNGCWKYL